MSMFVCRNEPDFDPWPEIAMTLRAVEAAVDMGIHVLYQNGDEHFAHCPLPGHPGADLNPSFSFNEEKLVYNCFICGGGNFIRLAQQMLMIQREAAIEWLIGYSDYSSEDDGTFLKQITRLLEQTTPGLREYENPTLPWYPTTKRDQWHIAGMENRLTWFQSRRIDPEVAAFLKLGWDHEHTRRGFVGPAIMIPHHVDGDLVGYQERWEFDPLPAGLGKYTNTPDFPRDFTLYCQDFTTTAKPLIVVESPMTVARLLSAGLQAVATFGAKVTDQQIKLLRGYEHLWIAYDNDDAGLLATKRIIDKLDDHCVLEIVPPPTHKAKADLGDCDDEQLDAVLAARVTSILYETGL